MNDHRGRGDWIFIRQLGAGAFGRVDLWQSKTTKDEIAIKKVLRPGGDHGLRRWQTEVKMMREMRHQNMVAFKPIPIELSIEYPMEHSLGMEYCSMGDLRKLMTKAEHCCGLPEYHVRDILHDIGGAIDYLHINNNMHRDLKPENIVLKPRDAGVNDRCQFKVTDLGYAKDLDEYSCGHSFVGTLLYLAPEVALGHTHPTKLRYFNQVDFWSLGVLIFECITGYRPFFHTVSYGPLRVLNLIRDKKDNEICSWFDPRTSHKIFREEIPQPHSLNPYFEEDVVRWLRLMLRIDETRRGGENGKEWYDMLKKKILPKEFIKVLDVRVGKVYHFQLELDAWLKVLKAKIQKEMKVPSHEQLLFLNEGENLEENKSVLKQLEDLQKKLRAPDLPTIYMFTQRAYEGPKYEVPIPRDVESYRSDPQFSVSADLSEKDEKRILQLALNHVITKVNISISTNAALMSLGRNIGAVTSKLAKMIREFAPKHSSLAGMIQLLKTSIEKDENEIRSHEPVGICASTRFEEHCAETRNAIRKWEEDLRNDAELIRRAEDQKAKSYISFLQGMSSSHAEIVEKRRQALTVYDDFRREIKALERRDDGAIENRRELGAKLKALRKKTIKDFIEKFVCDVHRSVEAAHAKYSSAIKHFLSQREEVIQILLPLTGRLHQCQLEMKEVTRHQEERQHYVCHMLQYMKDVYNTANTYYRDTSVEEGLAVEKKKWIGLVNGITGDQDLRNLVAFANNATQQNQVDQAGPATIQRNQVGQAGPSPPTSAYPTVQIERTLQNLHLQTNPGFPADATPKQVSANHMLPPMTAGAARPPTSPQLSNSANSNNNSNASTLEISGDSNFPNLE